MPLSTQFQLGLELTNIVNPLAQAVSTVGSLALVDAIRKSGSDAITEIKLASLIGRHRIDDVIAWHFREKIAKSDQSIISKYLDIVLESGAGPTVQQALKNPALFSMVIQLSLLGFCHERQSLANAMVEAIDSIVQDSGADSSLTPDYVSLLDTLRTCQEQTVEFSWVPFFESVEAKFEPFCGGDKEKDQQKWHALVRNRSLPFSILQSLIMWLRSIQSLPDHRILQLKSDHGVCTLIVWCHYVLGLTISAIIDDAHIQFGEGNPSVIVQLALGEPSSAILMDPLEESEPLFKLVSAGPEPELCYDLRINAYEYGLRTLRYFYTEPDESISMIIKEIITMTFYCCRYWGFQSQLSSLRRASDFLFGHYEDDSFWESLLSLKHMHKAVFGDHKLKGKLVVVLLAIMEVEEQDLVACRSMPLSVQSCLKIKGAQFKAILPGGPRDYRDITASFEVLSCLLLDEEKQEDYLEPAILASHLGWSVFISSLEHKDPFHRGAWSKLRVLRGTPSRRGVRKARIINGNTSMPEIYPSSMIGKSTEGTMILGQECKGYAQMSRPLIGNSADAFQLSMSFVWFQADNPQRFCQIGVKHLLKLCCGELRLTKACPHTSDFVFDRPHLDRLVRQLQTSKQLKIHVDSNNGQIYELSGGEGSFGDASTLITSQLRHVVVDVADSPAGRWVEMFRFINMFEHKAAKTPTVILLRSNETCLSCALNFSFYSGHVETITIL